MGNSKPGPDRKGRKDFPYHPLLGIMMRLMVHLVHLSINLELSELSHRRHSGYDTSATVDYVRDKITP